MRAKKKEKSQEDSRLKMVVDSLLDFIASDRPSRSRLAELFNDSRLEEESGRRLYKVKKYKHGKEIEFFSEDGFVSVAEVNKAIRENFSGYPREKLYFLISDETRRLTVGTTN